MTTRRRRFRKFLTAVRASTPERVEWVAAALSAILLIVSFPDFNLWPLAWVGLVPLMVTVARAPHAIPAFWLGWASGTLFFYGSCWWLTHAMIHFGGIPAALAYLLLLPAAIIVGLFPAAWCVVLARACVRWGLRGLAVAPFAWVGLEWARLSVTGQLWNAIGYSQAYIPTLIQPARWGGVYAVGFLILIVNASVALVILKRDRRTLPIAALACAAVAGAVHLSARPAKTSTQAQPSVLVVGVQPNVPITIVRTASETAALINHHLTLSENALGIKDKQRPVWFDGIESLTPAQRDAWAQEALTLPRVVVWPESPMNFTYGQDAQFRALVGSFARERRTSVLFNSLEPAPGDGVYNSAVMVNEEGRLVAQYDKIRLLPFGEYVPLPRWLPLTWFIAGVVGDFTPGEEYPLMPLDNSGARAGVFICFESAFPSVARTFADNGADVLINISNDGYLGRTPVIRQHLANAVFRAVENERPVLRVTNTGISAFITSRGEVTDATGVFEPAVRTWAVSRSDAKTFYTRHGDVFVITCLLVALLASLATLRSRRDEAERRPVVRR